MSFALGQVVGDYEFVDVVRSSHSAVSYRVRNLAENREEMLKVVVADPRRDSDLIQRFLRESRIHSSLRHPNILNCYKAFELQSRLVMTMELVEAVSLEDRLQADPMSLPEAAHLTQQLLRALAFAHDCTVVHREVTPANVLITPEGIAKLSGFNLACVASDPRLTQVGAVVGPIHYMSPEQVRSETIDFRSDIYSLGVVLYEILAGRKPFTGRSHFDILAAQVSSAPPPLATIRTDIPAEVCAVVEKALAKDPEERYQSCMEFAGALHRALERPAGEPAAAVSVGAVPAAEPLVQPAARSSLAPNREAKPVAAEKVEAAAPNAGVANAVEAAPPLQESSLLLQRPLVTIFITILFILASSWLFSRMS